MSATTPAPRVSKHPSNGGNTRRTLTHYPVMIIGGGLVFLAAWLIFNFWFAI